MIVEDDHGNYIDRAAYSAAYDALAADGVPNAQVRDDVSKRIVARLMELRTSLSPAAVAGPGVAEELAEEIKEGLSDSYTSVFTSGIVAAIRSAAEELA
jgi:hypothetical protein